MDLLSSRGRLIGVVTLVLVAAFLGTNIVSYEVSRQAARTAMLDRELPLTGNTIYSEIQTDLVRPIFVASLMAHDTFLRDWVIHGERDPARMRRYLDEIRRKYHTFTAFFVSERTRRYYHFTGVTKTVSRNDPRDAWFFRVRKMKAPYELNVDPDQQQGDRITIFINHKVEDYAGHFIGATGVGLELKAVGRIVRHYRRDFDRTVYFVNDAGLVTVHPDPAVSYHRHLADIPGMARIRDKILHSPKGAFIVQRPGGAVLVTTRRIPALHWTLVVEAKEAVAAAHLDEGFASNLAIGLAAILFTTVTIALAINAYQRRLERMATTDPLTGLHNRKVFDIQLDHAVERSRRAKSPLSLLMFDVDDFKSLNDRHGHLAGDDALRTLADLCRQRVRKSDTLCRWGGEEFVLLAENCHATAAREVAECLRGMIESQAIPAGGTGIAMTASFGVAELRPGDDAATLVKRADAALYAAKQHGRNRVEAAVQE